MADFPPTGLQTALSVGVGVLVLQYATEGNGWKFLQAHCSGLWLFTVCHPHTGTNRRFCVFAEAVPSQSRSHLIHVQLPQIKLQTDQLVKASLFKAWHYLPTFIIFSSIGNYVLGAVQTVLERQTVPRTRNVVSLYKEQINNICSNLNTQQFIEKRQRLEFLKASTSSARPKDFITDR